MKKLLAVMLVLALAAGMAACSKSEPDSPATCAYINGQSRTDVKDSMYGNYYLTGTWKMNDVLIPSIELTGKTQEQSFSHSVCYYYGRAECDRFTWKYRYLNVGDGSEQKLLTASSVTVLYAEGYSDYDSDGWRHSTEIQFWPLGYNKCKVDKEFYDWFLLNATYVSDECYEGGTE